MARSNKEKKAANAAVKVKGNGDAGVLRERKKEFEQLARPLMSPLYAMALRLQHNAAKAEDLVQETYLRAWRNFDRFSQGTNFKAWLFQILTYLHLNERRGGHRREATVDFSDHDASAPVAKESGSAAEEVARAAEKAGREAGGEKGETPRLAVLKNLDWSALYPEMVDDQLKEALDRLGEEQRTVFLLVTLGELSYQECAEALAIPVGTVMSRLFRARKVLQQELAEYAAERRLLPTKGGDA